MLRSMRIFFVKNWKSIIFTKRILLVFVRILKNGTFLISNYLNRKLLLLLLYIFTCRNWIISFRSVCKRSKILLEYVLIILFESIIRIWMKKLIILIKLLIEICWSMGIWLENLVFHWNSIKVRIFRNLVKLSNL